LGREKLKRKEKKEKGEGRFNKRGKRPAEGRQLLHWKKRDASIRKLQKMGGVLLSKGRGARKD